MAVGLLMDPLRLLGSFQHLESAEVDRDGGLFRPREWQADVVSLTFRCPEW
jgi:hypothetical protein